MNKFIFGLGAEKCGTTYISNLLNSNEFCSKPIVKEHHVFSNLNKITDLNKQACIEQIKKNLFNSYNYFSKKKSEFLIKNNKLYKLLFSNLPYSYFDYLEELLKKNKFTYDITPNYSSLDINILNYIKKSLEDRSIKYYIIFLLREPINRLMSMVQMHYRIKKKIENPLEIKNTMLSYTNYFNYPLLENNRLYERKRSNYIKTINNLLTVFKKKQIFFGFYERLNDKKYISDISSFFNLNLKYEENDFNNFKNKKIKLFNNEILYFKNYFRNEYDFVGNLFGKKIIKLWDNETDKLRY